MKKFEVYEAMDNFAEKVYESEVFMDCIDYLQDRFDKSDETDEQLFFSYFRIEEKVA